MVSSSHKSRFRGLNFHTTKSLVVLLPILCSVGLDDDELSLVLAVVRRQGAVLAYEDRLRVIPEKITSKFFFGLFYSNKNKLCSRKRAKSSKHWVKTRNKYIFYEVSFFVQKVLEVFLYIFYFVFIYLLLREKYILWFLNQYS